MVDKAYMASPIGSVVISKPEDMSRLLRDSCPERAREFALAAHERACWEYDDSRTIFWERVVDLLTVCADVSTPVAA